jgi:hypothetical protein
MTFELFCMTLIALLFGGAMIFGGYRLFLFLLPIWGFFFGFGLGAQAVQVIFSTGFLATITGWVVGFVVGLIFALLSYLFYVLAIALLAGSFGYGLVVSLWSLLGFNFGIVAWIIGIVVGVLVALLVLFLNIQKYAVIVITAVAGTGAIIYTLLAASGNVSLTDLMVGPARAAISDSVWWLIFFIVLSVAGIVVQIRDTRSFEVEVYNRMPAG